jgi:hypothetical protein
MAYEALRRLSLLVLLSFFELRAASAADFHVASVAALNTTCQAKTGKLANNKCFFTVQVGRDWSGTWSECAQNGGMLARFFDSAEHQAVSRRSSSAPLESG